VIISVPTSSFGQISSLVNVSTATSGSNTIMTCTGSFSFVVTA
jgi:hypothetical protein